MFYKASLGFNSTRNGLRMFSHGDKTVNARLNLHASMISWLGDNGNSQMSQLFIIIRGNESERLYMVREIGEYLCGNSRDSFNWL